MTLLEWRQKKRMVKAAREMLAHTTLHEMIATLKASSPLYFQARNLHYGGAVTPQDHSRMLGLIEGYALALDCLESMGVPPPAVHSQIQPTFEPEQE